MRKLNINLKPKSLQWQLLFRFFLILTVLLAVLGVSQYETMKRYLINNKVGTLMSTFHNVDFKALSLLETKEDIKENSSMLTDQLIDINIGVAIVDNSGNVITTAVKVKPPKPSKDPDKDFDIDKKIDTPSIPKLSNDFYISILNQAGNIERVNKLVKDENNNLQLVMWRKIGPMDSASGLIQLSTPIEDIKGLLNRQIYIYLGASALILIIGTFLGAAVFKRTLNPLYNMTNTIEQINVAKLHTRLPENNDQLEIDKLSNSFNNMLERIEISFEKEQHIKEKMRRFVSDASHELRTPLTSIHGFVEVLLMGAAKNENQLNMALNSILTESERLSKLVNDLLLLTKLDQQAPIEMKAENINDVINEVLPQLQILSGQRKIVLQLGDNISANVNRNQVKQIIFNLAHNAVQHTDEKNGIITISTNIEDTYSVIKIIDNGTGIDAEHLDEIFNRFFRSESHRSRDHGGYGLGLSIVKSIVDAHGGKITVDSELGKGTTFSIYFDLIK